MAQEQKIITISEYVNLVPGAVADTRIIAATQAAAELYGYLTPDDLIGRFLSQTLSRDNMLRGCLYSLARLKGFDAPVAYETQIVRPNGESIAVRKKTTQISSRDGLLWVTELERIRTSRQLPLPSPDEFGFTDEDLLQYRGAMNIADLESIVSGDSDLSSLPLTLAEVQSIMSEVQSTSVKNAGVGRMATAEIDIRQVDILPGQSRLLPDGDYLHRCARCGFVWISRIEEPEKCPRSRPDRRSQKACGLRHWRIAANG